MTQKCRCAKIGFQTREMLGPPNWTTGAEVATHPRRQVQPEAPNWIGTAGAIVRSTAGGQPQAAPASACRDDILQVHWVMRRGVQTSSGLRFAAFFLAIDQERG